MERIFNLYVFGINFFEYVNKLGKTHFNLFGLKLFYKSKEDFITKTRILYFRRERIDQIERLDYENSKLKRSIEKLNNEIERIRSTNGQVPKQSETQILSNENSSAPIVSIVIPIFNNASYLKECLDSVQAQSFKAIEVICIDDGSTDDSKLIIKNFCNKDKRFRYIYQRNEGAGAARNHGIKASKGRYLMFLDGDDIFDPNLVQMMFDKIDKYDSDVVICKANKLKEDKLYKAKYIDFDILKDKRSIKLADYADKAFQIFQLVPWNKMYRKELINREGLLFQNIKNSNDTFFVFSCLMLARKISIINKPLINYRIHSNSLVRKKDEAPLCFIEALVAIKSKMQEKDLFEVYKKSYMNRVIDNIYWNYGQITEATKKSIKQQILNFCQNEKITEYPDEYFYDKKALNFIKSLVEGQ